MCLIVLKDIQPTSYTPDKMSNSTSNSNVNSTSSMDVDTGMLAEVNRKIESNPQLKDTMEQLRAKKSKIEADKNEDPLDKEKDVVLMFCQVTPTVVNELIKRGLVGKDTKRTLRDKDIYLAAPAFNVKLAEKHADVKAFVDSLKAEGATYSMLPFGSAADALMKDCNLATNSIFPYEYALDQFFLDKAMPNGTILSNWLNENKHIHVQATHIAKNLMKFLTEIVPFATARKETLTRAEFNDKLNQLLGADWREVSGNGDARLFLKMFVDETDENGNPLDTDIESLIAAYREATVPELNEKTKEIENVSLYTKSTRVASFLNMFKPVPKIRKTGAISDMINYAAMMSRMKFSAEPTIDEAVKAIQIFGSMDPKDYLPVVMVIVDMEPDDMGALTHVLEHFPNAEVIRTYKSEALANEVEELLKSKGMYIPRGKVLIDDYLENEKQVRKAYFGN